MIQLVHASIAQTDPGLAEIPLHVDRLTLAKRLWRGAAEDGNEFGFELQAPLKHGDIFFQNEKSQYVIRQREEPVVEVSLKVEPSAAAGIGWAIGNLHLELSAEPARLLAPDEPAVRQLLHRLSVPFTPSTAIFRPGRFARGNQRTHEFGPSHKH